MTFFSQTSRFFFLKRWHNLEMIMKISFLLLFVVLLNTMASNGQNTSFKIEMKNVIVRDVLKEVENKTGYRFFFSDNFADIYRTVSVNIESDNVTELLTQIFQKSTVTFKILENNIVVITPVKTEQQGIIITGTVTEYGDPIPGVNVLLKGTLIGVITDANGRYTITVPNKDAVLVFSFVGYQPQEHVVGEQTAINITMLEDTKQIEEVVVIGYGSRSKRDITTAISNIDSKSIERSVSMSAENAMQGTMSGVQVSGNTGDPMARPTIRIRGTNSWGVSDPLYVIDGIAITELGAGIEGEDPRIKDVRGPLNIMSMIDPGDIESISVLKDASAAAIYGVRAANGVVLITTKKGRKDKPTVDVSARYGIQSITQELDWLTTPEYTKFVQGVFASDPTRNPAEDNNGRFDPADPRYLGNSPTYNWQDAVRNKNAPTQDYSIKISGGTDNTDYYVSLGYSNTKGTLLVNSMERYSGAVKVNTIINKWVKTGINYRLVNANGVNVYDGDNYAALSRPAPWQPIYAADGIPGYNGYAYAVGGFQDDGSYSTSKLYGQGTRINVLGRANTNDRTYNSLRNMGNVYLELTPLAGLSIKGTVSMDVYNTEKIEFGDYLAAPFDYTVGDPREAGGGKSVGRYGEQSTYNHNMIQELMVNYANSFGQHNFDFLFNFSNQQYNAKYNIANTEYLTTIKDYLRKLGGENAYTSLDSDLMRWALQGYLFRVGYNFAHKYYLDVTVRRDGSARFAPENRWGTFPSFSAAWRMTNEDFMSNISWLHDLKLRGGWGQLGNQEVRDMAYLSAISTSSAYAFGSYATAGQPATGSYYNGATILGIPNKDLTWEKTETMNLGFDAQLFGGLLFSAEYYYKKTHGILQAVDIPPSVGVVDIPVANVAKVMNRGFEFSVNYNGNVGELTYHVGANLTTTKNRVLETYRHIPTAGGTVEEGHSIFYHKAYKVAGIFQSDAEAQDWLTKYSDASYANAKVGAGDFYFQDLRGAPENEGEFYSEGADNKIDAYDQVDIGKSIPGHFYGVVLGAGYKGFDFSAQFTGVGDVMKFNRIKEHSYFATESDNVTTLVYKAWTPQNMQSKYPRLMFGDPAYSLRNSDFWYESGAYFRLQNIQLGYTLPQLVYDKCNNAIRNVRFYVGASNLFTITKYTGLDPESDAYPMPRTFYMGLTAKF